MDVEFKNKKMYLCLYAKIKIYGIVTTGNIRKGFSSENLFLYSDFYWIKGS